MPTLNPYLNFDGTTEAAFNFYKSVFGGEFISLQRFSEFPEGRNLPPRDQQKIMHIALPVGNGNILMATDVLKSMGQTMNAGNNFYISVSAASKEEATRLYERLSEKGKIEMPLGDSFWGAWFAMFRDRFGIQWMISYEYGQHEKTAGGATAEQNPG